MNEAPLTLCRTQIQYVPAMKECEEEIRRRIREQGRISFAEFVELALFHPVDGYYLSGKVIGPSGDYFTSGTAHPVFGALLALQLRQMWEILDRPHPFYVIEMGAGTGTLARDVVGYAQRVPGDFRGSLRYLALERYGAKESQEPGVQRIISANVPLKNMQGCFLSNELLDSFPAHRFQIEGGRVREVYVTLANGRFGEVLDAPSTPLIGSRLNALDLQEGFRGEVNLGIDHWLGEVAGSLKRGFLMTIDYGHASQELYSPRRSKGTLQCYYRHTQSGNPYVRIGEQDITAHVDFTTVMESGQRHGFETIGLVTQREFLNNLGIGAFLKSLRLTSLRQKAYLGNRMAMGELTRADGLGNFKVLVQTKGIENMGVDLYGLTPDNSLLEELEDNPPQDPPLLRKEHTPLMEGRYPHSAWEWHPQSNDSPREE